MPEKASFTPGAASFLQPKVCKANKGHTKQTKREIRGSAKASKQTTLRKTTKKKTTKKKPTTHTPWAAVVAVTQVIASHVDEVLAGVGVCACAALSP